MDREQPTAIVARDSVSVLLRWVWHPHGYPVQCSGRFPGALGLVFLLPCVCLIVSVCRSAIEVLCACDVMQVLFECVRCVFWEQDFRLI